MTEPTPIIPAATVVILRDAPSADDGSRSGAELEALLVRRNSALEFAGGLWVFPGGRVDDEDRAGLTADDEEGAARRAAVREATEEAGVVLDASSLVWFAHWTPPPISKKRFGTYFFAAPAPAGELVITIDGGEIHDHGWFRPSDALARRTALEIELAPPTWITLATLARHRTATDALAAMRVEAPEHFATRIAMVDDGVVALYAGDAGYEDSDASRQGARHRLWMVGNEWRYERDSWT